MYDISKIFIAILLCGASIAYSIEHPTFMEDVAGEYTLKYLKELVINKTRTLTSSMADITRKLASLTDKIDQDSETIDGDAGRPVEQADFENIKKTLEDTGKKTISYLTSVEFNILEGIEQIPMKIYNKTKELFGIMTHAASINVASDCYDLFMLGFNASGGYWLQKFGVRVLCDMETDDGGWLVIQRRTKVKEQVDFNKSWFKYKIGFGNIDTEFWVGNDILHILTNQKQYELLIEMADFENGPFYARYRYIRVGNEASSYSLDVGNYTGNSTDAFSYHHGRPFTTHDRDGDSYTSGNCAEYFSGGWWYDKCYDAHLNGLFPNPPNRSNASYITWWSRDEENKKVPLVLNEVTMKIRPYIDER